MVMAEQGLEAPSTDPKEDEGIPLGEVLGEAEARFGPMPTCLRSILLPAPPHPLASNNIIDNAPATNILVDASESCPISDPAPLNVSDDVDLSGKDGTGQTGGVDQEVCITLEDIPIETSPTSTSNFLGNAESRTKSDTVFLGLDDDFDENARRSPDSGCSMSEASTEDKISIASTVSASSDDGGYSRLGTQIQRLKQAMSELREQDVNLARQLLVVYDYVEETKWFLENFEACDPRHSIAGPLTSTERRFSQNFQKRLSDFGLNLKGIPHNGFASPPSWTDLSGSKTTSKRHSRNISDGMISIEHLRRIYHENNNNAAAGTDKSESCEALPDGPLLDGSEGRSRSPRSMTRRSISSNFLEISFSSMTASRGDHSLHQGPLSPISDSGQAVTMDEDADGDDDDEEEEEEGEKRNVHLQSTPKPVETNSPDTFGNDAMAAEERTKESESVSFYIPRDEDEVAVDSHSTADHHRGSASSSSASSMMSLQSSSSSSSSSTDKHAKSNSSHQTCHNTAETTSALPPHSTTGSSTDPTADECSIFIADDSNDHIAEDNRTLITSFESHMNWLQDQDETLL